MPNNVIQPSFAAGELSPTLFARVDLAKYRIGLSECYNFFVDYRGGVSNRPGTIYISHAYSNGNIKLIPFQFNVLQTYVLEFGHLYMRVIKDGGYVLEPSQDITGINTTNDLIITKVGHGYVTGDWVYVSGVGGAVRLNDMIFSVEKITNDTFRLRSLTYAALDYTRYAPWTGGGTVARIYKIATPWPDSAVPDLRFTQSADTMTLVHPLYQPYDLTRTAHNNWQLSLVSFAATLSRPATPVGTPTSAGAITYSYVVTAVDDDGNESLPSEHGLVASAVNMSATAGSINLSWAAVANAAKYNVYKAQSAVNLAIPSGTSHGYIGTTYAPSFIDSNITPDFAVTPPLHSNPFASRTITSVVVNNGGSSVPTSATLTVTDTQGTGAVLLPVINPVTQVLERVIVLNGGENYVAPIVSISAGTGVVMTATVGPAAGVFPEVVGYFQQRKVYANSLNDPQRFWMSRPGLFSNFDKSSPIKDDDMITGVLASQQVNNIKHMVAMPSGLIMLTGGGAWQISGGSSGAALSPRSITANPQAYNGVSNVPPIVVNSDILYVQSVGSIVRDLVYNFFANVYTGNDITVLSNHLFFNQNIRSWAYAEEPFKVVWACRDDGHLLSLTFLKEQDVYGWGHHETRGEFREACSIVEGDENRVYFVVRRNGINMIEQLASRKFTDVTDAWFVDSGVSYAGAETTEVVGLDHLEGQTVSILADGNVAPQKTVTGGRVTIPHAASRIIVGLPYEYRGATLAIESEPTLQGRMKKISAVTLRVDRTRGLRVGHSYTEAKEFKERSSEPYGEPIPLMSKDMRMGMGPNWDEYGRIYWIGDQPLPATVLGVIPEVEVAK